MANFVQHGQAVTAPPGPRRAWTRPAIVRLSAGSAEDGKGTRADSGVRPS